MAVGMAVVRLRLSQRVLVQVAVGGVPASYVVAREVGIRSVAVGVRMVMVALSGLVVAFFVGDRDYLLRSGR